MPEDLPVYSESMLRSGLQFGELEKLKGLDLSASWRKADDLLAMLEGARDIAAARASLREKNSDYLRTLHGILFAGQPGAGELRQIELQPLYRGQDCAPPEFIRRSLDNMESWLSADSFGQIHPIERCALTIARVIDIWPFEFGNLTTAVVFGNDSLEKAGFAPFFILPEHRKEFDQVVSKSMTIDMQPLINAIYRTVKKEMDALAGN